LAPDGAKDQGPRRDPIGAGVFAINIAGLARTTASMLYADLVSRSTNVSAEQLDAMNGRLWR